MKFTLIILSLFTTLSYGKNKLRTIDAKNDYVSTEDRKLYLKNSILTDENFSPLTPEQLLYGPKLKRHPINLFGDNYCKYTDRKNRGTNPKFRCLLVDREKNYLTKNGSISNNDVYKIRNEKDLYARGGNKLGKGLQIKVKYYPSKWAISNSSYYSRDPVRRFRDRFTEIAASRVLWGLGYFADKMYTTNQVTCFNCPKDPFKKMNPSRSFQRNSEVIFPDAAIELKYPGKKIESKYFRRGQGWSWKEAKDNAQKNWSGSEKFSQFEGLVVVMAMLNHISSRPEQQRLACVKKSIDENGICQNPYMMTQDLGSTFGHQVLNSRGGKIEKSKGSYKNWNASSFWKSKEKCEVALGFFVDDRTNKREYFSISAEGQKFISSRLKNFTDAHVTAIFKAAQMHKVDPVQIKRLRKIHGDKYESYAISEWVQAFQKKSADIQSANCPESK